MRWLIILWLFLISGIAYLDRVNLSIAGRSIEKDFHLEHVQLGWIFSAFIFGYALLQTPAGRLADRIGPRLMIGLGVIWWAIFTVGITIVSPLMPLLLPVLLLVRFLLGAGEAIVYPASNRIVAAWIPNQERGLANGIIFAGVGFGAGITPPLITFLMLSYGWRSAFWCSAALGLIAGAVWYVIARNSPAEHPWIKADEVTYIHSGLPRETDENHTATSWSIILQSSALWFMSFSYFAYGYAAYIFFSWFFIYLSEQRQLNLRASAVYTMLPFLAMAIASPFGGWLSDQWSKRQGKYAGRCGVAIAGMALAAVFIAIGTQVASAQLASIVLAGGAGALYLSQSSFWSVSADLGGKSAGAVSGFMNMCGQFGGVATASLTPWIGKYWGWNSSFLIAALFCLLGALAWFLVDPEQTLLANEQKLIRVHATPER